MEWWNAGTLELWNVGMAERRNDGMTERRNGGKSPQILKDGTINTINSTHIPPKDKENQMLSPIFSFGTLKGEGWGSKKKTVNKNSYSGTCQPRDRTESWRLQAVTSR